MSTASRSMNYYEPLGAGSRALENNSRALERGSLSSRNDSTAQKKKPSRRKSRSRSLTAYEKYSRFGETKSYGKRRRKRIRRRNALVISLVTVFMILLAAVATVYIFFTSFLSSITYTMQKDLDMDILANLVVEREKPDDPFWILLQGTDNYDAGEVARSDTMILARIDPAHKTAALISIPRDTYVDIPGFWKDKINAAYTWGSVYAGYTGYEVSINTVTNLTGIQIAYYAQIDINGFQGVVDSLGGVVVDVAVDVYNDYDHRAPAFLSSNPAIAKGEQQLLSGEYALLFVRSRYYPIGDYQRQANQRTFLQALARQTLASDPKTIVSTITAICEMTSSNITAEEIAALARDLRGMKETDIYTYSLPCYSWYDYDREISYEMPDMDKIRLLMAAIDAGNFPDPDELGLTRQGTTPASYKPKTGSLSDQPFYRPPEVKTEDYILDVRNGCGIAGCAIATADRFIAVGYQQGEIGNTLVWEYPDTLIIYQNDTDRDAALDIRMRLGYGRVIPSLERYDFLGNILIVVGDDYGIRNN